MVSLRDRRVTAHRNKLLGIWAAERMGLVGEATAEYVLDLVQSDTQSDWAIVERVCRDMEARGYPISSTDVQHKLAELGAKAREEFPSRE